MYNFFNFFEFINANCPVGIQNVYICLTYSDKSSYKRIYIIYIHSNEIHNVVALINFLIVLRCQLYMFRTVTVHPQELLW